MMNINATMFSKKYGTKKTHVILSSFVKIRDLYDFFDDYMSKFQTVVDYMEIHVNCIL